jgi:hypothetical protein
MIVFYIVPFVLVSLIAFLVFLAIPRLRPFAFRALIAPAAFGVCSIVAAMFLALAVERLSPGSFASPLATSKAVFVGIFIYLVPGLIGAAVAVVMWKHVELLVLRTGRARDVAVRAVLSSALFVPAFFVGARVQIWLLPRVTETHVMIILLLSLAVAGLVAFFSYRLLRHLQERFRVARPPVSGASEPTR